MSIIEVKNLTKKFGDLTVVDDLSFSIAEGELFGLLGPNGAGKTTTVRMLCSLIVGRSKRNGKM
jgi:ABC-2 type transport system ATP-binding protein